MSTLRQLITVLALVTLVGLASPADALNMAGFNVEFDTIESVTQRLHWEKISYETKTYGLWPWTSWKSLTLTSYPPLDKWGRLRWVHLSFTPSGRLYQVSIEWIDTGQTFEQLLQSVRGAFRSAISPNEDNQFVHWEHEEGPIRIILDRWRDPLMTRTFVDVMNRDLAPRTQQDSEPLNDALRDVEK